MPNLFADTVKTVSLFLLFSLSCATQAQFVIDNFNTNQTLISVSAVGSAGSTQRGTMQGNERDLNVTVTSPGTITAQVRTGVFTYTQDASAVGSADIVWDGIDGNASTLAPSGLGVLNFTASSQNAFMLGVNSCNQSVSVTLTIYSGGGTTKTVRGVLPIILRLAPQVRHFNLDDLGIGSSRRDLLRGFGRIFFPQESNETHC
ncbi:MAG: hypothetical protein JWM99_1292 [Verrucomicrobiales bacterium]|nr:hypothetical protein [Verrucomicrobiales bacterium]